MPNSQILARRFGVHWDSDAYIATAYPIAETNFRGNAVVRDLRPINAAPTKRPFWRRLKRTTEEKSKSSSGDALGGDKDLDATNATIAKAAAVDKVSESGKSDGNVSGSNAPKELAEKLKSSPQTSISSSVLNQTVPVNDTGNSGVDNATIPITTLQTDIALPKNESSGNSTTNMTGIVQVDLTDSGTKRITETNLTVSGLNSSSNSVASISVPLESSVPVTKLDGDVNGCKYCIKFNEHPQKFNKWSTKIMVSLHVYSGV